MSDANISAQVMAALSVIVLILGIAAGLLIFRFGYSRGIRKALIDPQHDYVMSVFYLTLLKKLDEKSYDTVKDGIAMRARHYVYSCREYEKRLPSRRISEIKKKIKGCELIANAEQLCGSLEFLKNINANSAAAISEFTP
jgi:hypothetical protein